MLDLAPRAIREKCRAITLRGGMVPNDRRMKEGGDLFIGYRLQIGWPNIGQGLQSS